MAVMNCTTLFVGMMVIAVMGMRVSVLRTVSMAVHMLMGRGGRHCNDALMAVAMFAMMVIGVCMR